MESGSAPSSNQSARIGRLGLFLRGLAMGAADVVPGVSGGTIAFITGIYQQFIDALKSLSLQPLKHLVRGRVSETFSALKCFHWATLLPLGLGVAFSIVTLSKVVTTGMEEYPAATYALFFGLILCSVIAPYLEMDSKSPSVLGTFFGAALLAWFFVGLHPASPPKDVLRTDEASTHMVYAGKLRTMSDVDALLKLREGIDPDLTLIFFDPKEVLSEATMPENAERLASKKALQQWIENHRKKFGSNADKDLVVARDRSPNLLWIFVSGFIAISAMVLPGLSGSFLLLFLGLYHIVFGALHGVIAALLSLAGRTPGPLYELVGSSASMDLSIVLCFGVGVLLGLAVFSRVVSWLFRSAKNHTLSALTGLMVGALRLPGEKVLEGTNQLTENLFLPSICLLVGMAVVIGLLVVDRKRSKRDLA